MTNMCAPCLIARITWEGTYETQLRAAITEAGRNAGLADGDPRAFTLDPAPFLPAYLQPGAPTGMPQVQQAVTVAQGSAVCTGHIPGRPGSQKLLIATGALSPSALAGLG